MRLDRDQLAELAELVVDELESRLTLSTVSPSRMVDAEELAARLGVDRGWVYANADRLGAQRLGDGPRARLRFDLSEALAAATNCNGSRTSAPGETAAGVVSRRRRRRGSGTEVPLLPIRGDTDG